MTDKTATLKKRLVELDLIADGYYKEMRKAGDLLKQRDAEIERLRAAFRINMLRLDPSLSHADIDRVIAGNNVEQAAPSVSGAMDPGPMGEFFARKSRGED